MLSTVNGTKSEEGSSAQRGWWEPCTWGMVGWGPKQHGGDGAKTPPPPQGRAGSRCITTTTTMKPGSCGTATMNSTLPTHLGIGIPNRFVHIKQTCGAKKHDTRREHRLRLPSSGTCMLAPSTLSASVSPPRGPSVCAGKQSQLGSSPSWEAVPAVHVTQPVISSAPSPPCAQ